MQKYFLIDVNHNSTTVKTLLTHFYCYYFIAVEPFPRMHGFKLDRYINNDYIYFVMAIEISALAFDIFYTVKEVKKIKEQGKKYFKVLISYCVDYNHHSAEKGWLNLHVKKVPSILIKFIDKKNNIPGFIVHSLKFRSLYSKDHVFPCF